MPIEVSQIVRTRRKTLALIVKPDGSVIVRAPMRIPAKSIDKFIEKYADWVERKRAEALAFRPPPPRQYLPGEQFLFLGRAYPLEIVPGQRPPLLLNGGFKLSEAAQSRAVDVFERWYRARAKQILSERVRCYAEEHGFAYKAVRITSARTRWGSCSSSGSLSFSWRLILAPVEVVDYVVVHELAHTVFHNHSKRFWKQVEKLMPDYKERKAWLRKNGQQLLA